MSKATRPIIDPESLPAKVTPMHIARALFDEKTGKQIIGKAGVRHETQWERTIRLGQMVCREMCTDEKAKALEIERALDRRDAGNEFAKAWALSEPGTKDSLDQGRGGGAPASTDGMSTVTIDAKDRLAAWERHMGPNDWMLVRDHIGANFRIHEAVGRITPAYRLVAVARMREAVDALKLAQAIGERCRRSKEGCCSPAARARRLGIV